MQFSLFSHTCKNCSQEFKAPIAISDHKNGTLMWDSAGNMACLGVSSSRVIKELSKLLAKNTNYNAKVRSKLIFYIFGITCDYSITGSAFHFVPHITCPACGALCSDFKGESKLFWRLSLNLPPITHKYWDSLSTQGKTERMVAALEQLLHLAPDIITNPCIEHQIFHWHKLVPKKYISDEFWMALTAVFPNCLSIKNNNAGVRLFLEMVCWKAQTNASWSELPACYRRHPNSIRIRYLNWSKQEPYKSILNIVENAVL